MSEAAKVLQNADGYGEVAARDTPSATELWDVPSGSDICVLDEWVECEFQKKHGFIKTKNLPGVAAKAAGAMVDVRDSYKGNAETCMRRQAEQDTSEGNVVCYVPNGPAAVKLLERWVEFDFAGRRGFVKARHVQSAAMGKAATPKGRGAVGASASPKGRGAADAAASPKGREPSQAPTSPKGRGAAEAVAPPKAGTRAEPAAGRSPPKKAKAEAPHAEAAVSKEAAVAKAEGRVSAAGSSSGSGSKRKAVDVGDDSLPGPKKAKEGRPVDLSVPNRNDYAVVDDWSVLLNQTNVGANNNKFYKIQVLKKSPDDLFCCWTHWGRVGHAGQSALLNCVDQDSAEKEMKAKFKSKTGVAYDLLSTHDWKPVMGKYTFVETDEQEGDGGDGAPLGKLTPQQIEKGQGVLEKLGAAMGRKGKALKDLQDLSSEYYTLIPHNFGFKVPPVISSVEMVEAEEELLKFFMRMGFEELDKADEGLSPVSGIMDMELPKSLEAACNKVCAAKDIKVSNEKGANHADKQSGKPTKPMEAHLYGAIMLYTSNAIYRTLNNVLRSEDRTKIKKYFLYLRLLLEALGRLPQQSRTLWRGVGVDLFDKYTKGSTVTWWGVSSCTADINVAKNFMNSCAGQRTLLTIKSKTAADISAITFFGNEKENLLAPGTQLKVVDTVKKGIVTEITLEEVGRALK